MFSRFASTITTNLRTGGRRSRGVAASLLALLLLTAPLSACTVFVLTDRDRTLFFNNEDWSNPASRLWFVPAGEDHLGCAYVGFDDGWAQGGVNTAGLAYDWVAGFMDDYTPEAAMRAVRGNSSQRMLETCTTVDEAIAFYQAHREREFARARILIADRTGASVIIGARNGRLFFDRAEDSRGFGYGWRVLQEQLVASPPPTVAQGSDILRACRQTGATATKYSNIFDLRLGTIWLYPSPEATAPAQFDLAAELARGGHWFELPELEKQVNQPVRPLPPLLRRFYLDTFTALPDQPIAIAQRIRTLIEDAGAGTMQPDHYSPPLWSQLADAQAGLQAEIARLGRLHSVTIVDAAGGDGQPGYRCLLVFDGARVLQRYAFDEHQRVTQLASEFAEPNPDFAPNQR